MEIALLGVPYDGGASYLRGSAAAPQSIRNVLWPEWSNSFCEAGIDLANRIHDFGDAAVSSESPISSIEDAVLKIIGEECRLVTLGGDHSITLPVLRAFRKRGYDFELLQIDAHPDLYDSFQGNRYSHACPFARIMEECLTSRLVQVGIRTMNKHQSEQATRFGVQTMEMREWIDSSILRFEKPVYVSVDLDAIDPAFAPGVSHPESGGLTVREVLTIIQRLNVPIIGADVVELNPNRDPTMTTAIVAAKVVKELAGKMLQL